jgi:hypothetical protein
MSASPQPNEPEPGRAAGDARPEAALRRDVRTALAVIRGYAQLAQRSDLSTPTPQRWMLAAWLRAIDGAAGTILTRIEQWEREDRN